MARRQEVTTGAAHPAGAADESAGTQARIAPLDGSPPGGRSTLLRVAALTLGVVLAVGASLAAFVTENPLYLRLAVLGVAWAFAIALLAAGSRRADQVVAAGREQELRHSYDLELEREVAARREYELRLENQLRREAQEAMRSEVEAMRRDLSALAQLRGELQDLTALRSDLRQDMSRMRAELTEQLSGEMLVERIVMRTQSIRMPADRPPLEAGGTVLPGSTAWDDDDWQGDRPTDQLGPHATTPRAAPVGTPVGDDEPPVSTEVIGAGPGRRRPAEAAAPRVPEPPVPPRPPEPVPVAPRTPALARVAPAEPAPVRVPPPVLPAPVEQPVEQPVEHRPASQLGRPLPDRFRSRWARSSRPEQVPAAPTSPAPAQQAPAAPAHGLVRPQATPAVPVPSRPPEPGAQRAAPQEPWGPAAPGTPGTPHRRRAPETGELGVLPSSSSPQQYSGATAWPAGSSVPALDRYPDVEPASAVPGTAVPGADVPGPPRHDALGHGTGSAGWTGREPVASPAPSDEPSGHQRLSEILAENGIVAGGGRRRRHRDDGDGDDVLARVLGRN